MADEQRPLYQVINGIRIPSMFSPKCFQEALDYRPCPDDVFIVTYPKSGTTWMQHLVMNIFRKGQVLEDPKQLRLASPFLDELGMEGVQRMPRPGAIKSHLPFTHVPYCPDAKYIYVARHYRATCVSLYHHTRTIPGYGYSSGQLDQFVELFLDGEVEYNSYYDHLLGWYNHRNDKNVFYTTYEEMKKDTKGIVQKLANFLGPNYGHMVERDNGVMDNILEYSSFQHMKERYSEVLNTYSQRKELLSSQNTPEGIVYLVRFTDLLHLPEKLPEMNFIRTGTVDDWKNNLSLDQVARLDDMFFQKTKGTDINSLWPNQ